jgi:hypothetical protein
MTIAEFFRVNKRTIRRWKAKGAPMSDAPRLIHWLKMTSRGCEAVGIRERFRDPTTPQKLQAVMDEASR